jgi:hypothetical protein
MNYYSARIDWGGGYVTLGTYAAMTEDEARTQAWERHLGCIALKDAEYGQIHIEQLLGMGEK